MPININGSDLIAASERAARESRVLLEHAYDIDRSSRRLIQTSINQVESSRRAMEAAIRSHANPLVLRADEDR